MPPDAANRWLTTRDDDRAETYDAAWDDLAATGADVHGEAAFVQALGPSRVLDAGCGTGRVAIELGRRGIHAVGVDLDATMLDVARRKAPDGEWVEGDLATVALGRRFDVVVAAGNVLIFVAPGTEGAVVANLARHLEPAGLLVAGFQLRDDGLDLTQYDAHCAAAGLALVERFATWERAPYAGGDYAVSVSRRTDARGGSAVADDGRRAYPATSADTPGGA